MNSTEQILEKLQLNNHIAEDDIPHLDLYMDQVIQLFDKTFADSKRNEKDKILTKTMINNYAKGGLLPPVKNKKYSREHIMLLSLIYELKGGLSINDIKTTLGRLDKHLPDFHEDLRSFYKSYLNLASDNADRFDSAVNEHSSQVNEESILNRSSETERPHEPADDALQHILLILTLTNMSNIYRKAAEKLVDSLNAEANDEK